MAYVAKEMFYFDLPLACDARNLLGALNIKNNNFATREFFSISPGQLLGTYFFIALYSNIAYYHAADT